MIVTSFLMDMMAQWAPPETERDSDRYADIAEDALFVAEKASPDDAELAFSAAVLLLSVASYESGFRADVDDGRVRGDEGNAWCLMQIHPGPGLLLGGGRYRYSAQGWQGKDLVADRKKCFQAGLAMIAESTRRCGHLGEAAALSVYTSGRCQKSEPKSRRYWARAEESFR